MYKNKNKDIIEKTKILKNINESDVMGIVSNNNIDASLNK